MLKRTYKLRDLLGAAPGARRLVLPPRLVVVVELPVLELVVVLARGVLLPGLVLLAASTSLLTMANSAPLFIAGVLLTSLAGTTFSIPSSMIVDAVDASRRSAAIGVYRVVGDAAFTLATFVS